MSSQVLKHRIAQRHIENDSLIHHGLDRGTGFLIEALQTSLNKEEYTAVLNAMTLKRNYLVKLYNAGQRTCKKASSSVQGSGGGAGGADALKALRRKQVEESIIRAKAEQILSLPNPEEGASAPPPPPDGQRPYAVAKDRVERLRIKHAQKQAQGRTHDRGLMVPEENAISYMQSLPEAQRQEMLTLPAERLEAEVGRLLEQMSHGHGPDIRGVKSAVGCWLGILKGDYPLDSFVGRSLSGNFRVYSSIPMFNAVMHYCPLWRFYVRAFKSDAVPRPCTLPGPEGTVIDASLWQLSDAASEAVGPSVEAPTLAPWARPPFCADEDEPATGSRMLNGMRKYVAQWTKSCKSNIRDSARKKLLQALECQGQTITTAEAQDLERLAALCLDDVAMEAVCFSIYRSQVCERVAELEGKLLDSSPLLFEIERSYGSVINSVKETHHAKSLFMSMLADEEEITLKELIHAERVADQFDWIPDVLSTFKQSVGSEHGLANGDFAPTASDDGLLEASASVDKIHVVVNVEGVPRVRSQRSGELDGASNTSSVESRVDLDGQDCANNARSHLTLNQYLEYKCDGGLLDFSFMIPPGCSMEELWRIISADPFGEQCRDPRSTNSGVGGRSFSELCCLFANLEVQYRDKYFHFTMDVLQKALDYSNIHQTLEKLEGIARAAMDIQVEVEYEVTRSPQGISAVRRDWLQAAHKLLECMSNHAQTLTQLNFSLQYDMIHKKFCEGFEMDFQHIANKGQELQEVVQQIKSQAELLEAALQDVSSAREKYLETPRRNYLELTAAAAEADGWSDLGCDFLHEESHQSRKKAELAVLGIKELQDGILQCVLGWRGHHDAHLGLRAEVLSYLRDRDDERLNAFCGCNRLSVDMVKFLALAIIREDFLRKAKLAADESRRLLEEVRAQTAREQLERDLAEQRALEEARQQKLALKKAEKMEKRRQEELERRRREEEEAEELRQRQQRALMEKEMRRRQAEEERQQQRQREQEAAEADARRRREELEAQQLAADLARVSAQSQPAPGTSLSADAFDPPADEADEPAALEMNDGGGVCHALLERDSPSPATPPNESLYFEDQPYEDTPSPDECRNGQFERDDESFSHYAGLPGALSKSESLDTPEAEAHLQGPAPEPLPLAAPPAPATPSPALPPPGPPVAEPPSRGSTDGIAASLPERSRLQPTLAPSLIMPAVAAVPAVPIAAPCAAVAPPSAAAGTPPSPAAVQSFATAAAGQGPPPLLRPDQRPDTREYDAMWGRLHGEALNERGDYQPADLGKGLDNPTGEYNCFLNVIIQSLWQLESFRDELVALSEGGPAAVAGGCDHEALLLQSLAHVFRSLSGRSGGSGAVAGGARAPNAWGAHNRGRELFVVDPGACRQVLSAMFAERGRSQIHEMADASEALNDVLEALHACLLPGPGAPSRAAGGAAEETLVTRVFGFRVQERVECGACGYLMQEHGFTRFFHYVPTQQLARVWACSGPERRSPEELLRRAYEAERRPCPRCSPSADVPFRCACALRGPPPAVVSVVAVWGAAEASAEDIAALLAVVPMSLDLRQLYAGVVSSRPYRLRAVVCFYGQHYVLIGYNARIKLWVQYDDSSVKVVGTWADVVHKCRSGRIQPHVIFYEAAPMG